MFSLTKRSTFLTSSSNSICNKARIQWTWKMHHNYLTISTVHCPINYIVESRNHLWSIQNNIWRKYREQSWHSFRFWLLNQLKFYICTYKALYDIPFYINFFSNYRKSQSYEPLIKVISLKIIILSIILIDGLKMFLKLRFLLVYIKINYFYFDHLIHMLLVALFTEISHLAPLRYQFFCW